MRKGCQVYAIQITNLLEKEDKPSLEEFSVLWEFRDMFVDEIPKLPPRREIELLTTAPILKVTNPDKDFTVCVDASKEGLGGVLTQEGHIICYESRKIKEHERNYITHDLELAAVIHALKMWRHYIMGRKILLSTDNRDVKYLFSQPDLNVRQARRLAFLSEFDFEVRHIKGKENKVADALSKRVHGLFEINVSGAESDLEQRIRTTCINDENYTKIVAKLQNTTPNLDKPDLSIDKSGLLRFKNKLYIPDLAELKITVLDEVHKKPYSGHPGYQKTITTLRKLFYWPNMKGETP
jgi:hypothetical protein